MMSVDIPPELPSYIDSASLPSYSDQLTSGEQRLDHTPRPRAVRSRHSGIYIKTSGDLSVVLDDQEENITIPVFGRRALIKGTVILSQGQLSSIREIVLKVEGKVESASSIRGGQSTNLINNSYTLWSHAKSKNPCLPQVPFSTVLPSTFQDGDRCQPLPPSYHAQRSKGLDGMLVAAAYLDSVFVTSAYQLQFIVTRVRHQKLQVWLKKQHIIIPFKYAPRTRPQRPIVPTSCFFSSIKTSPEEWYQALSCLEMRHDRSVEMGQIICHLFVPAGRTYGLTDTIKFHIQLTGLSRSLYTLFSGTDLDGKEKKSQNSLIHVTLQRRAVAMIQGLDACIDSILGEGTIWPIPPDLTSCDATNTYRSLQCHEGNIDWDGEVRCQSDVTVGGFHAANVQVMDFIVLTISPPTPTSPLLPLKLNVPVRLVTDSFSDVVTQMDSGATGI